MFPWDMEMTVEDVTRRVSVFFYFIFLSSTLFLYFIKNTRLLLQTFLFSMFISKKNITKNSYRIFTAPAQRDDDEF
jgi:hypothetical protein